MNRVSRYDEAPPPWLWAGRQRLVLFLVLAAWLHLLGFLGWERLGFQYQGNFEDFLANPQPVELALELSPAALEPEPAPRPVEPVAPPPAQERAEPPAGTAFPPQENPENLPAPLSSSETASSEATPAKTGPVDFSPQLDSGASLWPEDAPQESPAQSQARRDNIVSVEETAPRLKSYNTTVRGAVARHWLLPPEARSNFQPGRFTAIMTLNRQGQILVITVEESSGSPTLDNAAMEALRGAAPYEPFPEELVGHERLSFRLHFDYRAVYRQAAPLK